MCQQIVDENIFDAFTEFLKSNLYNTGAPPFYARWLVFLIVANLTSESEDIIELFINNELFTLIHSIMLDKVNAIGLFGEYAHLIANLVLSASQEQVIDHSSMN